MRHDAARRAAPELWLVVGTLLLPKPLMKGRELWGKRVSPGYAQRTVVVFGHDQCQVRIVRFRPKRSSRSSNAFVWPWEGAAAPRESTSADEILAQCDFVSIGANDLTQFILAADRNALATMDDYTMLPPSVLPDVNQDVQSIKFFRRFERLATLSQCLTINETERIVCHGVLRAGKGLTLGARGGMMLPK